MKTFKIRDISGNTITIVAEEVSFEPSHVCFWKTSRFLVMAFLNGRVAEAWEVTGE